VLVGRNARPSSLVYACGFTTDVVNQWLGAAGLEPVMHKSLPPGRDGKIAVSLWLARDNRALIAGKKKREVA
jgi:hypothetical protein